ncbi:MAG: lipopolysaccharide kinase InaA family protein [Planctomycetota bacterium]
MSDVARFHVSPEYEEGLARRGITSFGSAMAFTGGHLVAAHKGRSTVRIDGDLFLKRFPGDAKAGRGERKAFERLGAGPGPDAVPVAAWGESESGSFLVTVRPPGVLPIPHVLRVLHGEARRRFVTSIGSEIRAMHDRGFTCPDLFAHHLLAGRPGQLYLIDAARLAKRKGRKPRARDLAALDLTFPYGEASDAERVRLLTGYLGERPSGRPDFTAALDAAARKLSRRRRWRRDRLVAAPEDRKFLESLGIASFEDLFTYEGEGAIHLRTLADRSNWRIETRGRVFFAKRHLRVKGRGPTPAAAEWNAARMLARAGVLSMRGFALGEDVGRGSVIWVEKSPGRPLDDLLTEGAVDTPTRREIVIEVAGILRRMRRFEIHHRDFYACHLITAPDAPAGERITVIDLQRVRKKPGLRKRWFVKDAAALWHSAPRPPVTNTDAVRFLREYFGVAKLGPREKAFAAKVAGKAAKIARHAARKTVAPNRASEAR